MIFLIATFIAGFLVVLRGGIRASHISEGMADAPKEEPKECPDMLVKKGNSLLLYNTKAPILDGVNPMPFFSMDEYINYVNIQKNKNIECPVLFLQQENDAQGQDVYRMRPSPFYVEGGLPPLPLVAADPTRQIPIQDAGRDNPPFNQNMFPGFDPTSMDVGRTTAIDVVHASTNAEECSANAADSRWCGPEYTNTAITRGDYSGSYVGKVMYPAMRPL
jgi:hypothetical protein